MTQEFIRKEIFEYKYVKDDKENVITREVDFPLVHRIREYGFQIMTSNNIPCYLEDDFFDAFEAFVKDRNAKYSRELASSYLEKLTQDPALVKSIASKWAEAFKKGHAAHSLASQQWGQEEDVQFGSCYNELLHSPALHTLLRLEHGYAAAIAQLVRQKDSELAQLRASHEATMEDAIQNLGSRYTEQDINYLSYKHFEEQERLTSEWNIKTKNLMNLQRQEFREWVLKVYDDCKNNCGSPKAFPELSDGCLLPEEEEHNVVQMEESFTIHLGSQLKSMCNLRVLVADVLDLCKYRVKEVNGGVEVGHMARRLQTDISLYSHHLRGLVLLVDNRVNSYSGLKHEFSRICHSTAELHFADQEEQLELIRGQLSVASTPQTPSEDPSAPQQPLQRRKAVLEPGDFYVTRHSNLPDIQLVFHLVTDDSLRGSSVSSRHPVLLGLRNILRIAHEHDVATITLPLLLSHDMTEEMTIQWCMKRAELVFKCIKGFMIEMTTMLGSSAKTIQFLLPKDISEELFPNLCGQVPNIFRLSNPLVLSSK